MQGTLPKFSNYLGFPIEFNGFPDFFCSENCDFPDHIIVLKVIGTCSMLEKAFLLAKVGFQPKRYQCHVFGFCFVFCSLVFWYRSVFSYVPW